MIRLRPRPPEPRPAPPEIAPDAPWSRREHIGRRMLWTTASILGAPLTLVLLVPYLRAARRGERDRYAPLHYSCVTLSMVILPFLLLAALHLLG